MRFATPVALLILLGLIPFIIWLGYPRLPYRRRRDTASLMLRLIIIILLVLGLAGLQTVQAAEKLSVVFLVDASDSLDQTARDTAENYIRDSLSRISPDDRVGIVVFGKNALVERPVSGVKEFSGITSTTIQLDTNIAEAIRLGLAMFPNDSARRLVILSDGIETLDSAVEAARLAAATNVQIDVLPLRRAPGPEVLVSEVRVPTTVNQGELFDLGVTIESKTATRANLTILSGGQVIQTSIVDLDAGTNNFVLQLRSPQQGFTDFQVRVDPVSGNATDTYYQNNQLAAFTEVTGPPRVLIVAEDPQEASALVPSMQEAGLTVDIQTPADLPLGLAPLAAYKAVVLVNVSATELTDQRMRVLQSYARDLGGGLVVIGGPNSYGVGGYYQTPLEEALPVDMQIRDQQRIPRLTIVYVIDRSGSMEMAGPSGVTNLELAKEAARRSINFLFERDRAGILSFDSNPQWLVPIQFVSNRTVMFRQIGALRPGGGTDIAAAVNEIARTLPSDPSTLKHVILLTDGGSDSTGIVETVRQMNTQHGITVTAIGIGQGVPPFMRDIAVAGKGTYYNLFDVQTIPQIFAAETVLATRSYIVEEPLIPLVSATSPILRGIEAVPPLLGYVATSPKPTATVILVSPVGGYNDPILASWQYGLGRVVAWTSDAAPRWSANWIGWEGFQRFWSQVIRSTILEGLNSTLETRVERRDGKSVLIVEARDDQGSLINGLNLAGSIVDPRLGNQGITLRQVAPGRYEAEFDAETEGAYFIRVAGVQSDQELGVAQTTGWVLSYSPEYRLRETNTELLEQLASLTSGRVLDSETTEPVFRRDIQQTRAATSLSPLLILLAILLLPIDIAVRRVVVTPTDLQKLQAWILAKLGLRVGDSQADAVQSARMAALKGAKARAAATKGTPNSEPAPRVAPPTSPTSLPNDASLSAPTEPAPAKQTQVKQPTQQAPKPAQPPIPTDGGALAARLAEKRRQRKD
ncbi:MAG: VWA domain-containing protein [Anaerolineae bacterium]